MADFYGAGEGKSFWRDDNASSLLPETVKEPTIPIPAPQEEVLPTQVNNPAGNVTMVQPLIVVPFSSQMQPLYQYTPEAMNAFYNGGAPSSEFAYPEGDGYGYAEDGEYRDDRAARKERKARKVNVSALFTFLFALIALAVSVISYFVDFEYILVADGKGALAIIMGLTDAFGGDLDIKALIMPAGLALGALFGIITALVGLFSVGAKRFALFGKITAVLALIFTGVALAMMFVNKAEIGYGAYIITALYLITAIIALTAKGKKA